MSQSSPTGPTFNDSNIRWQGKNVSTSFTYADIHAHVSLKPWNRNGPDLYYQTLRGNANNMLIWSADATCLHRPFAKKGYADIRRSPAKGKGRESNLKTYDQATMTLLVEGKVSLAFNSMTPFEYPLVSSGYNRFLNRQKSKANKHWLKHVAKWDTMTHWDNLFAEYQFLCQQQRTHRGCRWDMMNGKNDLINQQINNVDVLVVNVLEGGHSLQGKYFDPRLFSAFPQANKRLVMRRDMVLSVNDDLHINRKHAKKVFGLSNSDAYRTDFWPSVRDSINKEIETNILRLKHCDPPFFMLSTGHLAYNHMVNMPNALDVKGPLKVALRRFYRARVDDDEDLMKHWAQTYYSPPENTVFGRTAINAALSKDNGHRIYIDLRHSGYDMRKWYFDSLMTVRDLYGDTIPPVCSHCPANGLKERYFSPGMDEYVYSTSKIAHTFYPFSNNLYDEEIKKICDLNGIIGIPFLQRVLGDDQNKKKRQKTIKLQFESIKADLIYNLQEPADTNPEYFYALLVEDYLSIEPFLQNLFYIIDHSGKAYKPAWKHVCIGSDFDGGIDPIDIIPTAKEMPYFQKRVYQLIPVFLYLNQKDFDQYFNASFTLEIAVKYLFYDSLYEFVVKYFPN